MREEKQTVEKMTTLSPTVKRQTRKTTVCSTISPEEDSNLKIIPATSAKWPYRKKQGAHSVAERRINGRERQKKKSTISSTGGENDVRRRPGRKSVKLPAEIPPELLKKPREKMEYRCSVCSKDFPYAYKLERHRLTHTGEKPHRCSICGRGFNQKGNLKTHYKVHTGRKDLVDWDGEGSTIEELPDDLEKQTEEPRTESSLQCLECGKGCENPSALQAHHVTMHTKSTAGTNADTCATALQLHFCQQCGFQFNGKEQLEDHMKCHLKEKPYSCPDCGKGFLKKSYIQVHQRIHTGEKPFLCSECGKGHHTASALKLHEMQHSGERPFACSVCGKRFRTNSYLTAHYQTHIKERSFLCSVCGKGYARAEELKAHHRLHTGERPYQCRQCGKRFIYRQGLRQHERTHSGRRIGPTQRLGRPKQQPRLEN